MSLLRKKSLGNEQSLGNDRCAHGRSTSSSSSWNTRHRRSAQRCSKFPLRTRLSDARGVGRSRKTNAIWTTTSTIALADSVRTTTALPRSISSSSARFGCREKAPQGSISQRRFQARKPFNYQKHYDAFAISSASRVPSTTPTRRIEGRREPTFAQLLPLLRRAASPRL